MMLFSWRLGASLLSFSAAAYGAQLNQPRATVINHQLSTDGWTPAPTKKPEPVMELVRRQQQNPSLCGYIEGDKDAPVTCGRSSTCLRNPQLSWFGCCTGTSLSDCNVQTACIESRSVSACLAQAGCPKSLALFCTSSASPYCGYLYKTVSGQEYGNFECAKSPSASFELFTTPIPGGSSQLSGSSSSRRSLAPSSSSRVKSSSSSLLAKGDGTTRGTSLSTPISSTTVPESSPSASVQQATSVAPQATVQSSGGESGRIPTTSRAMAPVESTKGMVWAARCIIGLLTLVFVS